MLIQYEEQTVEWGSLSILKEKAFDTILLQKLEGYEVDTAGLILDG